MCFGEMYEMGKGVQITSPWWSMMIGSGARKRIARGEPVWLEDSCYNFRKTPKFSITGRNGCWLVYRTGVTKYEFFFSAFAR